MGRIDVPGEEVVGTIFDMLGLTTEQQEELAAKGEVGQQEIRDSKRGADELGHMVMTGTTQE